MAAARPRYARSEAGAGSDRAKKPVFRCRGHTARVPGHIEHEPCSFHLDPLALTTSGQRKLIGLMTRKSESK